MKYAVVGLLLLFATACGGEGGETVQVTIPEGSGLSTAVDSLAAKDVIEWPFFFKLYVRVKGAERSIRPGVYGLQQGASWGGVLDKLIEGDVLRFRLTVPEGWTLSQITERVAEARGVPADSLRALVEDTLAPSEYGVPGPTLEGYLYPATYTFRMNAPPERMLRAMVARYKEVWTPELRARADSLGLSEREVVTLASIIEKEAKVWGERDTVSAVYHNRLEKGMRLQADPTVQYARGEHVGRLLYAHIDQVAENPYNTYTHTGLPPGPIASPSAGSIRAALYPADVDYLFFVARPDGRHVFTRTYAEHLAAKRQAQRARAASQGR